MLLEDIKKFVKELSNGELTHLDPSRVRIYLSGLVNSEDERMSDYKTGVIPKLVSDLNETIDMTNDIRPLNSQQEDSLFYLAQRLSLVRNIIIKELTP
tara:strand:- start:100 stop:393 length:294 start_codon:yes stop_codon:yes gene_type:complete